MSIGVNATSGEPLDGRYAGLDDWVQDEVGETILQMRARYGEGVRLDMRKLDALARDGLWRFLMSNFAAWNWEYHEKPGDHPHTDESTERAWGLMFSSVQEWTGLPEHEVGMFLSTLLEVQDMGNAFDSVDGFIPSAEDVDRVFGGPMQRIEGYREKARRVLTTVVALLLVDDGSLSGRVPRA